MRVFTLVLAATAALDYTRAPALVLAALDQRDTPIVSSAGSIATIGGWYMQSTERAPNDMTKLSQPGADISSWYRVGSHGTVMV
jgi:exo-1,4-beta-D-glucosaminidase